MSSDVRATCPGCQQPLRIPAEMLGKSIRCKSCGTVVRSKLPGAAPHPVAAGAGGGFSPSAQPAYGYPPPTAQAYAPPAGYGVPPGYPAPSAPLSPQPLAPGGFPAESMSSQLGRYKRGGGSGKYAWIAFGLLFTCGIVAAGIFMPGYIKKLSQQPAPTETVNGGNSTPKPANGGTAATQAPAAPAGTIPRRMLFIHASQYLYLNPLTASNSIGSGSGPDRIRADAKRLAYEWRVPVEKDNNQLYVLSDTGMPKDEPRLPFAGVIHETLAKFCEGSRSQDRVLVYFGGHAVEKEGKAYLIPMEGDPDETAGLIPVADFYAKLAACPAQQKAVIWDVCRYNPQRGRQRPGAESMTPELEKALTATIPPGVEVVTTCSAKENALEFYSFPPDPNRQGQIVIGSNFLEAAVYVAAMNKAPKALSPADPLPIKAWVEAVSKRVADVASAVTENEDKSKPTQTPKVYGTSDKVVAFDPSEKSPPRFALPEPPKGASPELVSAIASEFELPAIKKDLGDTGLKSFPFPSNVLKEFTTTVNVDAVKADGGKTLAFEFAVVNAFETIRKQWEMAKDGDGGMINEWKEDANDAAKKKVKNTLQTAPAVAISELEGALKALDKAAPMRAEKPKRWQANYDYAVAQTKARLAYMHEYDLMLGNILTDSLPALDPKMGQTYWRLATADKMKSKKDIQTIAEESLDLFNKIIEEYKGTPWAIQAKRDKTVALGLRWLPSSDDKAMESK